MARHQGITNIGRGRYRVRVTWTDPKTGKRKEADRMLEGTINDALDLRLQLIEESRVGAPRERQRFAAFARSWLAIKLPTIRESTATKYANDLDLHILPALGDHYLDALRPSDVAAFIAANAKGRAGWSVKGRLRLLRTMAKDALADGLVDCDFTARVKPPPTRSYDEGAPNLLGADELRKLLSEIPEQWNALVLLMTTTGLRWGEASGLKWSDIDEGAGLIRVERTNWKGKLQPPKTKKSKRSVPLLDEVAIALLRHRRRLMAEQNKGLARDLVFPTQDGVLHRGTPLRSVLERAITRAELGTDLTAHGLRRSFNNLARKDTSSVVLHSITGHSDDRMTEHYSMVSADEKRKAAAGVLRLIKGSE